MSPGTAPDRDPARTLELLWGAAAPPSRGPKPALSLDQIVRTAIRLADDEGLPAVSMRRVAEELGFTTMSLYRYVPSKDDLLELMQDAAASPLPSRTEVPGHWRDALRWWARNSYALTQRHPWIVDIPISRPPMGPNNVRWMEYALWPLRDTGLTPGELLGILQLVSTQVLITARLDRSLSTAAAQTGVTPEEWDRLYGQMLSTVVDPSEFPAITSMIDQGMMDMPDDELAGDYLDFAMEITLNGIETFIAHRRGSAT